MSPLGRMARCLTGPRFSATTLAWKPAGRVSPSGSSAATATTAAAATSARHVSFIRNAPLGSDPGLKRGSSGSRPRSCLDSPDDLFVVRKPVRIFLGDDTVADPDAELPATAGDQLRINTKPVPDERGHTGRAGE